MVLRYFRFKRALSGGGVKKLALSLTRHLEWP